MKCTKTILSNERLLLREFTNNDWIDVHKYASQDKVCQYQPWGPNTAEDSKEFVNQVIKDSAREPRTRYVFAIVKKDTKEMVGEIHYYTVF